MTDKEDLIELTTEDGKIINCVLFDMVEYLNKFYAILVESSKVNDEEPEIIIMRYRDLGNDVLFEQITDDTEREEVFKFINELSASENNN